MTLLEDYKKAYETGLPFFLKLFKMSDLDLKDKLKSILKNKLNSRNLDLLEKSSDVIRTIRNENPEKISIQFYDWIEIYPLGISFHPEHGNAHQIVDFDEHFIL
jgi:hypothetical protein